MLISHDFSDCQFKIYSNNERKNNCARTKLCCFPTISAIVNSKSTATMKEKTIVQEQSCVAFPRFQRLSIQNLQPQSKKIQSCNNERKKQLCKNKVVLLSHDFSDCQFKIYSNNERFQRLSIQNLQPHWKKTKKLRNKTILLTKCSNNNKKKKAKSISLCLFIRHFILFSTFFLFISFFLICSLRLSLVSFFFLFLFLTTYPSVNLSFLSVCIYCFFFLVL